MKLSRAASYFDRMVVSDGYSGVTLYKGQLGVYDDSTRDGLSVERRILSMAPDNVVPARRVVSFEGDRWLVGDSHKDSFDGEAIRQKHICHQSNTLAFYRTSAQVLSAAAGTQAYAARYWLKDLKETEVSSGLFGFYQIFFSTSETVKPGHFINFEGRIYRARGAYKSSGGFLVAESDELAEGCLTSATYNVRTIDPVTEVASSSTSTPLVLRVRFQDYNFRLSDKTPSFVPGDIEVLVRKASVTGAKVRDQITFSDGIWNVVDVQDDTFGCWLLHCRHV